jgi:lipoprotein-releasing system permease protein
MALLTTFEKLLASRFLVPGAGGRLALLIAAIGCAGIMIGVASLVLVVSFMNGAEVRLAGQIASADGHLFVSGPRLRIARPAEVQQTLVSIPGVQAATASLDASALITAGGRSFAADLQGVQPSQIRVSPVFNGSADGIAGAAPTSPGTMALGSDLADRLGIAPGDHAAITMVRFDRDGLAVDNHDLAVSGVVSTKVHSFDSRRVIMPIADLQAILRTDSAASKINVRLSDPEHQDAVVASIKERLGPGFTVATWQNMNAVLFAALAQERLAMTLIMSLVTLIALSNVLSSMVMLVRYKTREIAILRTMGMSRYSTAKVFVVVGATIGFVGELAGLALGFGLKAAKDPVTAGVSAMMDRPPIELDVLLSLPLVISPTGIAWIVALVSIGVVISTLYPALRAAAVDPASVLRHT